MIAAHAWVTVQRLGNFWWWQDDLALLGRAAHKSLPSLLVSNYNGHLIPGTWLLAWLTDKTSVYGWAWGVSSIVVLSCAADVALLLLLIRLFGARWAVLVPLTMYVSAGSLLKPTMWWAAAMQWLPATVSLLLALYFHEEFQRSRQRRDAAAVFLSLISGLCFFEKAVLIGPYLYVFSCLYHSTGNMRRRIGQTWKWSPDYWRLHIGLTVSYSLLYLGVAKGQDKPGESLTQVVSLAKEVLLNTVVPSVFGGPLEWVGAYANLPAPPTWFRTATWLATFTVIGASLRYVRGAWRAWVLLLAFALPTIVLLARTRLGFFGPVIGLDGRYSADLVAMTVVCFSLACLPLRIDHGSRVAAPVSPREGRGTHRANSLTSRLAALLVGVTAAAVAAFGLRSGATYVAAWRDAPVERYVGNLRNDLIVHPGVVLFDQQVPDSIMINVFGDDSRLSVVTRPMRHRPTLRPWQTKLQVVDGTGRIRDGQLAQVKAQGATAKPECTQPGAPLTVSLGPAAVPLGHWTVHLGYAASRRTSVSISLGFDSVTVPLERGLHEVYIYADGVGSNFTLNLTDPSAGVCVANIAVGEAVARSLQ